jgi:anti-anti-sigma regulatory factor
MIVDVSALAELDEHALETLVRLQLRARRLGTSIVLHGACEELCDLLTLAGLSDVLPLVESARSARSAGTRSARNPDRNVEEREQPLVDEEIDPGDAAG